MGVFKHQSRNHGRMELDLVKVILKGRTQTNEGITTVPQYKAFLLPTNSFQ